MEEKHQKLYCIFIPNCQCILICIQFGLELCITHFILIRWYGHSYFLACLIYEGKWLNNRNLIIKRLSNMPYRGRGDRAVWTCAIALTTWLSHCQLEPWKSNEALFVFLVVRGCETFWNLQENEGSVCTQLFESGESVWMGGNISKRKTKRHWWIPEWETS